MLPQSMRAIRIHDHGDAQMMRVGAARLVLVVGLALGLAGCKMDDPTPPKKRGHVEWVKYSATGEVAGEVKAKRDELRAKKRTLLVYVGATWCEPCRRFHEASEQGELDRDFPNLTLLEFDLDKDGAVLAQAGYTPRYIPYFGVPAEDGRATDRSIEGSVKGDQAVSYLTPKLKDLLR
jgi:thiol-disulfide isomerase/thioredoxin